MVTIEINNSTSKINNLKSTDFVKLRKELSYSLDSQASYFSGRGFNTLRYCIDKHGVFNTGLLLRVHDFLAKANIKYLDNDVRGLSRLNVKKVDHKPSFGAMVPYLFQVEATKKVLETGGGIISAVTGSGKSFIMALIASRLSIRTLIVVPSIQIKEQLLMTFKTIFKDMSNITICNIDSSELKIAKNYDCLIIDEAHHAAAKTYQKLNKTAWAGISYRVFLTATPFRNQTEETLLFEGIAGPVIYKLSYKDAVLNKFIVPIESYYIEVPKAKTAAYSWVEVYSELVTNNLAKNQIIAKTLLTLQLSGISTLCLVKEIKHGNNIAELTGLPFANGQDETTREYIDQFNKGKIKVLIGTEGILGEGVDTRPCEFVIIAGLGKAKSALMQKVGRALRTYPGKESGKVILILDRSHRFLLRHYKEQCKVLKEEYGTIPIRLEI